MTFYSREFKAQIVEQHRQGRSLAELGREFHLSPTSVANWVRAAERRDGKRSRAGSVKPSSAEEKPEDTIARLERELERKDEDLKILGKALAFFVRRSDQ